MRIPFPPPETPPPGPAMQSPVDPGSSSTTAVAAAALLSLWPAQINQLSPSRQFFTNTTTITNSSHPVHTIDEEECIIVDDEFHSFTPNSFNLYSFRNRFHHSFTAADIHTPNDFSLEAADHPSKLQGFRKQKKIPPLSLHAGITSGPTSPLSRSLTSPTAILHDMTTFATAPGSPPDLTGSKSSKSSSLHSSSQFSSPDGITTDISHFEDIGLDDDSQLAFVESYAFDRYSFPKRPTLRSTSVGGSRNGNPVSIPSRELTSGKRPGYPSLHGQIRGALIHQTTEPLTLPNGVGTKRGFTSPSTPSLSLSSRNRYRSRSPSPSHPSAMPGIATSSLPNGTPHPRSGLSPNSRKGLPSRRGSWQPSRKTIKELEDEYHDSDEDLPEDAHLWNVPVSPRPPQERSASTSPERKSPAGVKLSQTMSLPIPPPDSSLQRQRPPRTLSLGPNHGRSNLRDARAKSWTAAMSALSDEARTLTEALEAHAEAAERKHEENVQRGVVSARPSLEKSRSSSKTLVELPPLNKGNVMIDPLPISKEKEKVLTRTRPSWLPPKDQKEEKRHLKEYQRMMAMSLEGEKRRAAAAAEAESRRDSTNSTLHRIWEQYVCPDWDRVTSEHRTRELWWRGIPPNLRGAVWERAIGNELALTKETYNKALQRARDVQSSPQTEENRMMKEWFDAIRRDAETAFPDLNLFQPGGPLHESLVDILYAYTMYRSDVGYLFGIHLIAALFLLTLPTPHSSFLLLANALNRPLPLAFLTGDPSACNRAYDFVASTLAYKIPHLHAHLFSPPSESKPTLSLTPEEGFEPMFRTLLLNGLDPDHGSRLLDVWVFEGDSILVRAAVAVVAGLEARIYAIGAGDGDGEEQREIVRRLLGWGPRRDRMNESTQYWEFNEGSAAGGVEGWMEWVREVGKK